MATTATRTAGEICTAALRKIGVVAKDEPADASDMAVALAQLDDFLKHTQLRGITRYKRSRSSVTVTDATASYTLTTRPLSIETVLWRDASGDDTTLTELSASEYDELSDKDSAGGQATQFYFKRDREAATLHVWPVKATAGGASLVITELSEVEDIAAAADVVDAPREWYLGLTYALSALLLDDFRIKDQLTRASIEGKAERFMQDALDHEREASFTFAPDWQGQY